MRDPDDDNVEFGDDEEGLEEDWSRDFDDLDADYWENHFDPLGDVDWDTLRDDAPEWMTEAEELAQDSETFPHQGSGFRSGRSGNAQSRHLAPPTRADAKRAAIMRWIGSSRFASGFADGPPGFVVAGGQHGRLRSGEQVEVVEWLVREGVLRAAWREGYRAVYCQKTAKGAHCIKFWSRDQWTGW